MLGLIIINTIVFLLFSTLSWQNHALGQSSQLLTNMPSIKGKICNTAGIPLPKVTLEAVLADKRVVKTITDEEGTYEFRALPAGNVTISVKGIAGLNFSEIKKNTEGQWQTLPPQKSLEVKSNQATMVDFVIYVNIYDVDAKATEIIGIVTQTDNLPFGEANKPISEASIKITNVFSEEIQIEAKTDANGNYKLSIPVEGQYLVQVSKLGYTATAITLLANGVTRRLNFALSPLRL